MIGEFIRYALISSSVAGFVMCFACWVMWKRQLSYLEDSNEVAQAKTLGALSGFNSFVMAFTAAYFVYRYLVRDNAVGEMTSNVTRLMVLVVFFLIIAALCLPGLISYLTFRAERRGLLTSRRNQADNREALEEIREEQRQTRRDLGVQESQILKELNEEQEKLREEIAKRDTLRVERDEARDEADMLRDKAQGTDLGQGHEIMNEQMRVREEKEVEGGDGPGR